MSNKQVTKGSASVALTREQVRAMLRKMLPEFKLSFEDDRADDSVLETLSDDDVIELIEDKNPALSALDRLDRAAQLRD